MLSLRSYAPWALFAIFFIYYGPHIYSLSLTGHLIRGRAARVFASVLFAGALCAPVLAYPLSVYTIILAYLFGIWLALDFCTLIVRLMLPRRARRVWIKLYRGGIAIAICVLLLAAGYINMRAVRKTEYTVETDALADPISIALISDLHLGLSMDAKGFETHLAAIKAQNPDLLMLAGDLFDEGTTRAEMEKLCASLADFPARYGVYYVFGNHDAGRYSPTRAFHETDIETCMTNAGVTVLNDEAAFPVQNLAVVGRRDAGDYTRKSINTLLSGIDRENTFIVLIDHQPADTQRAAEAGVDLMLSGHTHNGQLFPINLLSVWFHINEVEYGKVQIGDTAVIVSSGIAGWGIPVRTCGRSEYVMISIE